MSDWRLEKKKLSSTKLLTSNSKLQLHQLIKLLEDVIPVGRKLLEGIPTDHFKEPMFIKINIFERHINRIEVIIPLLKQWEESPFVEDSIGLIVRACLSDVISQFYLEDVHSKVRSCPSPEEDEYLETASSLLADHIHTGLRHIKALTDSGVFTREQGIKSIDDWRALYPPYFKNEPANYDNPTKNVLPKPYPSASQIIKLIRNSDLLKKFDLDNLYIGFFFYSKYEHFGATTNSLQNTDMNMLFYFMMDSFTYILLSCQLLSVHFEDANYKYYKQINSDYECDTEGSDKIFLIREEFVRILNTNRPTEYIDPI
ncbi:MAG: hypothetical protein A3D31_08790 [Candidatus Fluviicola riflensis]|nr:MAG: hypothetical protein CHH17_06205 [Candidatus Fluviicola riflensis]OGS80032.1 MAG: hypothetical protein A3D31_08790 [Candidatus Fluviicola riflensis]OGS82547.1 MAG: hypothetical protein A2724_17735 [Fluviicola sp. RIFCSPHIGHO2_01_FULL_43_53]OGS88211.1 MAG: hypothetical protein A3E30_15170 [Fluviicola sp. RIFCSPHIGHO2_12_FULL_43_24]